MHYHLKIIAIFTFAILISCDGHNDKLYDELETHLAKRQEVTKAKEESLARIKVQLKKCKDIEKRYLLCDSLIKQYLLFNSDSASHYIDIAMEEAILLERPDYINKVRLLDAYILATSGHYNEAKECLEKVDKTILNQKLTQLYYETWRWLYNTWEAYVKDEKRAEIYDKKGAAYLDTLCMLVPAETADGLYFAAEKEAYIGNLKEAEKKYLKCIGMLDKSERRYASATCALAMVYETQDRFDDFEHYMILAAISDQTIPLKENLALQELADYISHHKTDYTRAQRYLVYSVEDAIYYNNRLRLTEIARKLPDIARGYQEAEDELDKYYFIFAIIVGLMAIGLFIAVIISVRQNKTLMLQRKEKTEFNEKLRATNRSRNSYICLFIELCAGIIDKYNTLSKNIERKIRAHQTDDIPALLHSSRIKDKDTKEMMASFDRAFLNLYPQFVEEFNALLQPEYRIHLKKDQLLNSELRIMAFVKLGVKDTSHLSTLLAYSSQTIYNYRSTLRSHAINKEHFEEDVERLCEVNET